MEYKITTFYRRDNKTVLRINTSEVIFKELEKIIPRYYSRFYTNYYHVKTDTLSKFERDILSKYDIYLSGYNMYFPKIIKIDILGPSSSPKMINYFSFESLKNTKK